MLLFAASILFGFRQAIRVDIMGAPDHWRLERGGKPYFVKGIGGYDRLNEAVQNGANSFRLWGADQLEKDLDRAQAAHMTVCAGIWLGHRSYFDYTDAKKVAEQKEMVRKAVMAGRNHPALLFWALGNEMETEGNDTPALWRAIDDLAVMVKTLDPNHPVMSVVADADQAKIDHIKQYAPHLDLMGFNSYGGLGTLPDRLKTFGWNRPYVVTEFGHLGPWEMPKTAWGAPIELTSTQKAKMTGDNYEHSIKGQPGKCLGSYAFLWGHKQEATPTWFGLFLPKGEPLEGVERLRNAWLATNKPILSPQIEGFAFESPTTAYPAGQEVSVRLTTNPRQGLTINWEIRREAVDRRHDGEGETTPSVVSSGTAEIRDSTFRVKLPSEVNHYRLYIIVHNGTPYVASANLPFAIQ